jgi:anti-sigma regulatory factor (Ser/Thr protein kinase)
MGAVMLTGLRDWLLRLFGRGEPEPDIWLFQIKGQRREIGAINDALERAAAAGDVPEPPMRAMQVALDELLTNSIMHGAASDTNPVRVQLVLARNYLRAVITHADSMFDPTQMATPDTEAGLHERDIGGLGIHLVRNMMDEFEHRYDNGCNVVTIGKRF